MAFKKGWAAVSEATSDAPVTEKSDFTSFPAGDTKVVKFKSLDDVAGYFSYSIYQVVNTFVPENPATFNDRGFVESNLTSWDKASKHFYDRAKNDKANEKALKNLGYRYGARQRFMVAVFDLSEENEDGTFGKDIVIDLTKKQAGSVMDSLMDYVDVDDSGAPIEGADHDFLGMAFKLKKSGSGTDTVVSLSPIVNLAKGLSKDEKSALDSELASTPIPDDIFEDLLFTLDNDDMLRGLVKAEFQLSLIGEVAPPPKDEFGNTPETSTGDAPLPESDTALDDGAIDVDDDDLPF